MATRNAVRKRPPPPPANPPPAPQYGFKINRLHCKTQEDWIGKDEPYFVSVAVDARGNVVARQSDQWIMDSGDTRRPNWYVYPPRDCGGFLDVVVALYENDGGYRDVGRAVGATLTAAGAANPYVAIAGGIFSIAGEIVAVASALDDDDELGVVDFMYRDTAELRASVGAFNRKFRGDDANYTATFELISI